MSKEHWNVTTNDGKSTKESKIDMELVARKKRIDAAKHKASMDEINHDLDALLNEVESE